MPVLSGAAVAKVPLTDANRQDFWKWVADKVASQVEPTDPSVMDPALTRLTDKLRAGMGAGIRKVGQSADFFFGGDGTDTSGFMPDPSMGVGTMATSAVARRAAKVGDEAAKLSPRKALNDLVKKLTNRDDTVNWQLPEVRGVNMNERRPLIIPSGNPAPQSAAAVRYDRQGNRLTNGELNDWTKKRVEAMHKESDNLSMDWSDDSWARQFPDPEERLKQSRLFGALSPSTSVEDNIKHQIGLNPMFFEGMDPADAARLYKERYGSEIGLLSPFFNSKTQEWQNGAKMNLWTRAQQGQELNPFDASKTENMAQGMMNNPDAVPIDIHLLRTLGSISSVTPPESAYRVTKQGFSDFAKNELGEQPWTVMQRVWSLARALQNEGVEGLAPGQYLERLGFQGIPREPLSATEFSRVSRGIDELKKGAVRPPAPRIYVP